MYMLKRVSLMFVMLLLLSSCTFNLNSLKGEDVRKNPRISMDATDETSDVMFKSVMYEKS